MADEIKHKEAEIYDALRTVVDPEIGLNIIELGLVRGMELTAESLHLKMILPTPFCPYGPALLEQTRRTAQTASGLPTTIELSADLWDPSMMEEGAGGDWGLF